MMKNSVVVDAAKAEKRLMVGAAVIDGNKLYFSIAYGNGLFCYDMASEELQFLGEFEDEEKYTTDLYCAAIKYDRYLLFAPFNAKKMAVYDLVEGKFSYYDIFENKLLKIQIVQMVFYKDALYLFGNFTNPVIIKIDLKEKNIVTLEDWYREEKDNEEIWHIQFYGMCQVGSEIYVPVLFKPSVDVISFDMETQKLKKFCLNDFHCSAVGAHGNDMWVTDIRDKKIYRYSSEMKKIKAEHTKLPEGFLYNKDLSCTFAKVMSWEQYIYFLPGVASHIIKYDTVMDKMTLLQLEGDNFEIHADLINKYHWVEINNHMLYAFHHKEEALHIIDLQAETLEKVVFEDRWGVGDLVQNQGVFYEGMGASNKLSSFLEKAISNKL